MTSVRRAAHRAIIFTRLFSAFVLVFTMLFASYLVVPITALAAEPELDYAVSFGGSGPDWYMVEVYASARDGDGNHYLGGYFEGTIDFEPGSGTTQLTALAGDLFVTKLDASGNLVWAKHFSGDSYNWLYGIALDSSGNVYATGEFSGTTDFDPGAGVVNLTAFGSQDTFIVKLDSSGNFVWAAQPAGTANDEPTDIKTDTSGNVFVVGKFRGTIDADPGVGVHNLTVTGANDDGYVIKLDTDGNFVWAYNYGSASGAAENARSLNIDTSGNVYVAGIFNGLVDFDFGAGSTELTGSSSDMYLHKMDTDGNFVWVKGIFGSSSISPFYIDFDSSGNIINSGSFSGTADFDPGAGTSNLTGSASKFIQKLDSNGDFVWAVAYADTTVLLNALALDSNDSVYTYGRINLTQDLDPGPGTVNVDPANGRVYLLKLDSAGNFEWVQQFATGASFAFASDITIDENDNIFAAGGFEGTADFDPGAGTSNMTSLDQNGNGDAFFLELSPPAAATPTVTTNAASVITDTTVTLNGTIDAEGASAPTTRGFEYGTTVAYGTTASESGTFTVGTFTTDLTGLTCNTTYHFRAFATSADGTGNGSDDTFTTAACVTAPTVTTNAASVITDTTVILNGTIDAEGTTSPTTRGFEYGLTAAYGTTTTENGAFTVGAFTANLTGLTCNTTYHFRGYATSPDGAGQGSDATFTTSACAAAGGGSGGGGGSVIQSPVVYPPSIPYVPELPTEIPDPAVSGPTQSAPTLSNDDSDPETPGTDTSSSDNPEAPAGNSDTPSVITPVNIPDENPSQPYVPVSSTKGNSGSGSNLATSFVNRIKSTQAQADSLTLLTLANLALLAAMVPVATQALSLSAAATVLPLGLAGLNLLYTRYFQNLLSFLGLRKKRRVWGTVYDSQTKQPLDPAVVQLIDLTTGEVKEIAITDLAGRFGFLATTGTFLLKATKTHYSFPSQKETGSTDEIFDHLYHGEAITLTEGSTLVAPNIPMDPIGFDWNQAAKQKLLPSRLRLAYIVQILFNTLFAFGFVFATYNILVTPNLWNTATLTLYIMAVLVRLLIGRKHLWGRLTKNGQPLANAILELTESQLGVVMGKGLSSVDGKFFLKAPQPGQYQLTVKSSAGEVLFQGQAQVGKDNVLNDNVDIA